MQEGEAPGAPAGEDQSAAGNSGCQLTKEPLHGNNLAARIGHPCQINVDPGS
jgi:hypothetical protein